MKMQAHEWLRIIRREYAQRFLLQGGASVKFVVCDQVDLQQEVRQAFHVMAGEEGFCAVHVDARSTKIHMIDRFFHQIAHLIDWETLAYEFVVHVLTQNGYTIPTDRHQFTIASVAHLNDRAEPLLRRDLTSWLEHAIFRDVHMCQEFRTAMLRLCLGQLDKGEGSTFLTQAVLDWLAGDLRQISALKEALIFQKIVRSNARYMIASLGHWLRLVGKSGLMVTLDLERYFVGQRPDQPEGFYYSPRAVLDAYEMLRQCIDTTDDMEGVLFVVFVPPEFLTDQRRGVSRYEALKMRMWDDVRDRDQPNPLGALVSLTSSIEKEIGAAQTLEDEAPTSNTGGNVFHQRVIEGMRAGVPNRAVVQALGSTQPELEGRFQTLLDQNAQSLAVEHMAKGMLFEGGFGAGKSHLIEAFLTTALERNFVCSRVVISKETPLYNVMTMYRAAIEGAVVPQTQGTALAHIVGALDHQSFPYAHFSDWVHQASLDLDSRFAASFYLYEHFMNDPELRHRMIRFWSGDPLTVSELKKLLKGCSSTLPFAFQKISMHALALQRFLFVTRLILAAGYAGWILFVDEAEIIGRYSWAQRVKSYRELGRWMGMLPSFQIPGLASVVAMTDDFQSAVLEERKDREKIQSALQEAESSESDSACTLFHEALQGIQAIEQERWPLAHPHEGIVDSTYQKIRTIHGSAYNWNPPSVSAVEHLSSTRMREYVRGWITEWDLKRLFPQRTVNIEVNALTQSYSEDHALESSTEEDMAHVGVGEADERVHPPC